MESPRLSAGRRGWLGVALAAWWRSRFSTFHREMLRATRRAPPLLGESTELVRGFLLGLQNPDGGFRGRAAESDLYYTGFALDGLLALWQRSAAERNAMTAARGYLASFGSGEGLDLVHLCCLARGVAAMRMAGMAGVIGADDRRRLARRIEGHRSEDGGYHSVAGQACGTAYAAFLALGAYQDLGFAMPQGERVGRAVQERDLRDVRDLRDLRGGATGLAVLGVNPAAAALAVLVQCGKWNALLGADAAEWFMAQWHPMGGFCASALAPIPDLLSTATALHTLAMLGVPVAPVRALCLDFIDSLWNNRGSFHAHWQEDELDAEYTFYGLLALGHLA